MAINYGTPPSQVPFSPSPCLPSNSRSARLVSYYSPSTNTRTLSFGNVSPPSPYVSKQSSRISLSENTNPASPPSIPSHYRSPSMSSASLNSPSPTTPYSGYTHTAMIGCPSDSPPVAFSSYFQDVDPDQTFMANRDQNKEKSESTYMHQVYENEVADDQGHRAMLELSSHRLVLDDDAAHRHNPQSRASRSNLNRENSKSNRRFTVYGLSKMQSEACLPSFKRWGSDDEDSMSASFRSANSSQSSFFPLGLKFPRPPSTNPDAGNLFTEEETREVREFLRVWDSHVRRQTGSTRRLSNVPSSIIDDRISENAQIAEFDQHTNGSWEDQEHARLIDDGCGQRSHDTSARCSQLLEAVGMMVGLKHEDSRSLGSPLGSIERLMNRGHKDLAIEDQPESTARRARPSLTRLSIEQGARDDITPQRPPPNQRGARSTRNRGCPMHVHLEAEGRMSKEPFIKRSPHRGGRTASKRWGQLVLPLKTSIGADSLSIAAPDSPAHRHSSTRCNKPLPATPRDSMMHHRINLPWSSSTSSLKVSFPKPTEPTPPEGVEGPPPPIRTPTSSRFRRFSNPIRHASKVHLPLEVPEEASNHKVEQRLCDCSRPCHSILRGSVSHDPMPQSLGRGASHIGLTSFIDMDETTGQKSRSLRSSIVRPTVKGDKVKRLAKAARQVIVGWGRSLAGIRQE